MANSAVAALDIHASGGQKGFTTALGNHANVSAFVNTDKGHTKYRGKINGTKRRAGEERRQGGLVHHLA
jgi:hypothetical protein